MGDPDIEAALRDAVHAAMAEQHLTQQALADRLGVTRSRVAHLLSGSRGRIPVSIVNLLDAVGLELVVRKKDRD